MHEASRDICNKICGQLTLNPKPLNPIEFPAGSVWIGQSFVASAKLPPPPGISKDDLLINQDFPVYSWNVGGIEGDYHTVIQNQVEGRPGNRRDGNGSETEWHVPQLVIGRLFGMAWVFDGLPSGYKDGGTLLDIADYQNLECNRTYSYGSREVESPGYLEPEIFHSDQEQTALVEHQVDSPVYLEPEIFNSDQVEGDETTATGASASTDRKPRMTQDLPEQDDQKLEKKQGPLDPEDRIPEKEEVHRQGAFSLGIWNRKGIEDEVKVVKGCSQRKPLQGSLAAFKRRESEASLMPVDSDCDVPTAGGAITQVGFLPSLGDQKGLNLLCPQEANRTLSGRKKSVKSSTITSAAWR
ncbi:cnnm4 [Symbiodinium sp. KB8]|nr:cnnm4 [Symbiodinium sp. KB8]